MKPDNRGYGGARPGSGPGFQDRPRVNYSAMTQYHDEQDRLKKEVFVDWPKQIADSIRVSRSNMRRAYDFVAAMRFRISMGEDAVAVLQPGMGQLRRFVQYQAGRDRAWEDAKAFFQTHCDAVGNDPKKFEGFYQLFQSVMAYLRR